MIRTYDKLPIGKYGELMQIIYDNKDEGDIDMQMALISSLYGISEDELLNMSLDKYGKYAEAINFLLVKPMTNKAIPKKLKINGKRYTVIKNARELTAGQYIDWKSFIQRKDYWNYFANILAIVIIPKGKKYGEYDPMQVADEIGKHLDTETAYNIFFFFAKKSRKQMITTLRYLEVMMGMRARMMKEPEMKTKMTEAKTKLKQMLQLLQESGFGTV